MGKVYISCTDKEWSDMEDGKINIIDYKGTEYVRVVRCKDCRLSTVTELRELYCYRLEDIVGADDYCSWGERREDAETD